MSTYNPWLSYKAFKNLHPQWDNLSEENKYQLLVQQRPSVEELDANAIPYYLRDGCSYILIHLQHCRQDNFYLPWKCGAWRHAYERCEHDGEHAAAARKLDKLNAETGHQ